MPALVSKVCLVLKTIIKVNEVCKTENEPYLLWAVFTIVLQTSLLLAVAKEVLGDNVIAVTGADRTRFLGRKGEASWQYSKD